MNRIGKYFPVLFLVVMALISSPVRAQESKGTKPRYPLSLEHLSEQEIVKTKNYYLLSLLQEEVVKQILVQDPSLQALAIKKKEQLHLALKNCKDTGCLLDAMRFTDIDIDTAGAVLSKLYMSSPALSDLVKQKLRPSKAYYQFNRLSLEKELIEAWKQDIKGVNYTIDVYGGGEKPNYPNIDSIAFNVKSRSYMNLLYDVVASIADDADKFSLFFESSLESALRLLEINERFDASNLEPMTLNDNQAAILKIKTTAWDQYPYSLILVPGAGPEDPTVALSAEGMLRCRVAANRFREGLAPFIMVSGGNVHPYKTKFNEAVEMKKYLVKKMGIPEEAILVEPHARHTTTNMRNCARIMYNYGFPMDKWALTSTDRYQSHYISNMEARCMKELGYVPYKLGKRLSDTEQAFLPLENALQINPYEPLDP
ncbi:YdcF family protein [Olivibacter sp. XZL3]|uniref:YdcF family protein n=1 Tax=Olivibacter sp. XZL3 TaxID=1735116 RepID=UPI0019811162|nr:YdcF family protein [Olivibacter sp. XZL3]